MRFYIATAPPFAVSTTEGRLQSLDLDAAAAIEGAEGECARSPRVRTPRDRGCL